jgi:predicted ester cyclase
MEAANTQAPGIGIVKRLFEEVWGKGNNALLPELFHDPAASRRGMEKFGQIRQAFPDLRIEVERYEEAGEFVIAYYKVLGTHTGEFMGRPPTQKKIAMEGSNIYRFRDGKISEGWGHVNTQDSLRELFQNV